MDNLKKLRQEIGLTQQSLAKELNTSQQSVYKYEHHITEPDISMLKNMADVFNVSVDFLDFMGPCRMADQVIHGHIEYVSHIF